VPRPQEDPTRLARTQMGAIAALGDVASGYPNRSARRCGERISFPSVSTCLVTGGAGFLGSHLCDELLAREHRVICVDNLETGSLVNIEHIRDPARFVHLNVDIIDSYYVEEPIDYVYHLASPASPIDYLRLPLHTLKVGSYGTHHTLGLAKAKRARFLLASTSEVYGDPQQHPQPESYWGHVNPIGPRGVYDEAKRYAEALTMAYHRQQGVDTAIVRIFNTYGSRMRPHDGRAIPTFLRQALADRPITVFGEGNQTRSFCYVSDLIRGLVALAESDYHDPVNIGNPDEFTLLELAETVREVTGSRSEIIYEALPEDDPKQRRPDITLARELLGWAPEVGLRAGLARTIEQAGVQLLSGRGG
jgi:dTDP-glucose 4,6-dehydratase